MTEQSVLFRMIEDMAMLMVDRTLYSGHCRKLCVERTWCLYWSELPSILYAWTETIMNNLYSRLYVVSLQGLSVTFGNLSSKCGITGFE